MLKRIQYFLLHKVADNYMSEAGRRRLETGTQMTYARAAISKHIKYIP